MGFTKTTTIGVLLTGPSIETTVCVDVAICLSRSQMMWRLAE